jgi:phosphatidylglycerophosphate synthase
MYRFEDKRSGPVAVDKGQVLPLVFAIVTFICSLLVTIIHAVARRKAKEWMEWNRSDKLIRKSPLALWFYMY